jgi:hypothetical protein
MCLGGRGLHKKLDGGGAGPFGIGFVTPFCTKTGLSSRSSTFGSFRRVEHVGVVPKGLGGLKGLALLDISNSQLRQIPMHISNYTNLNYIFLQDNLLSGTIPSLRRLHKLKVLNLTNNQLTGGFPLDILEHLELTTFDLRNNRLGGIIPSLSNLTKLTYLNLDNNRFTKFEDSWLPSPNLRGLHVEGNLLEGMIPASLADITGAHLKVGHSICLEITFPASHLVSLSCLHRLLEYPGTWIFLKTS